MPIRFAVDRNNPNTSRELVLRQQAVQGGRAFPGYQAQTLSANLKLKLKTFISVKTFMGTFEFLKEMKLFDIAVNPMCMRRRKRWRRFIYFRLLSYSYLYFFLLFSANLKIGEL